ncbi:Rad52/Rad22 family DNA repair protein [Ammoniphilus resinae]|uniref:Uncharacterized protein n=1 Tax=Ammoniphilus resinae TaxID=861532 RepID=A0ABS4GP09_9BACL|nr:Rad52/Rad22 family DNA repair protein [Ammoniphilus resinae]MBP1931792.1 hypothetical protein [Ammoniphilus resinae]
MSNLNVDLFDQLNLPFRYEEYGVNYEGQVYIGQQSVADRLNQILGIFNWELDLLEINVNMEHYSVSVLGCLRVFNPETQQWITRKQYGNDTMTIHRDETVPRPQAIEDAKKSAVSDALKKTASWIGVAADVYQGKLKAVNAKDRRYHSILAKFGLNGHEFQYKNGVVFLPDSYRSYFDEKGWNGLFESDLANLDDRQGGSTDQPNTTSQGGGNKKPQEFRVKTLSATETNQDGTSRFKAMLESRVEVTILVPSELTPAASNTVAPNLILKIKGWYNENKHTVTLAKNSQVKVESSQSKAS